MLQALYERGIAPDFTVGASAGALKSAFVAGRPQDVLTANELAAIWTGLRRRRVCPVRVQPMDFGHAESLIERALVESRRTLGLRRKQPALLVA
jgi:predicted acylesterase/phospholipase RssA